jgi:hypothetical protein
MARLFLDMDGVLTDFDTQFQQWFGVRVEVYRYKSDPDVKAIIDRHLTSAPEEFWSRMPWMPGAREFWNEMEPRSPVILSSPHFARACIPGKHRWIQAHLGSQVPVIFDSAKGAYGQGDDMLVDDSPENAIGWKGLFVLHTTWSETRHQIGFHPYLCEYQI